MKDGDLIKFFVKQSPKIIKIRGLEYGIYLSYLQ